MKKLYVLMFTVINIFIAFTVIHLVVKHSDQLHLPTLFKTNKLNTIEQKINLFSHFGLYLGLYLLALAGLIMLYRIVSGRSPVDNKDPSLIRCINQLLSNTLEQSLIFGSFYLYWLHHQAKYHKVQDALLFPFLFLFSRCIFTVLYLISTLVKIPVVRSSGFAINVIVIASLLIQNITSVPLLTKYFG